MWDGYNQPTEKCLKHEINYFFLLVTQLNPLEGSIFTVKRNNILKSALLFNYDKIIINKVQFYFNSHRARTIF